MKYYKAEDVHELIYDLAEGLGNLQLIYDLAEGLGNLPIIEINDEEDKAEWVKVDKSGLRCSKCGSIFRNRGGTKIPKHCPECGKKTIGVE